MIWHFYKICGSVLCSGFFLMKKYQQKIYFCNSISQPECRHVWPYEVEDWARSQPQDTIVLGWGQRGVGKGHSANFWATVYKVESANGRKRTLPARVFCGEVMAFEHMRDVQLKKTAKTGSQCLPVYHRATFISLSFVFPATLSSVTHGNKYQ